MGGKRAPKVDPEFRELLMPLSRAQYTALEESLKSDGCKYALIVWDGKVLDGHNRLEICQKHDIEYTTMTIDLPNRYEAKVWVLRKQLTRPKLTQWQRIELAQKLEPVLVGPLQNAEEGDTPRDRVARLARVKLGTLIKANLVAESADEETRRKLRNGETTIHREYKWITKEREAALSQEGPRRVPGMVIKEEIASANKIMQILKGLTNRVRHMKRSYTLSDETKQMLLDKLARLAELVQTD